MIISKTPYRLSLFGGGTDYPEWYSSNKSHIITAAIDNHCYLSVKYLPNYFSYKHRIAYSRIEMVNDIDDIDHPSVRNILKYMNIEEGLSITHDGEIPANSGVGSSSSFTVGLINALFRLKGIQLSKKDLAQKAIYVEQFLNGESVGIQDQIAAAYGGLNKITAGFGRDWEVEPVNVSDEFIKQLENHILLGFTGKSRFSGIQARKQIENFEKNKIILEDIIGITKIAIDRIEREDSIEKIADMIKATWSFKKNLTDDLTNEKLDNIIHYSELNGSLGGKLMGAGGGGFFMFVVPPEKQENFKKEMKNIKVWVPFKLNTKGSEII
jgi:D-glycero-alpha-D-manno-heptose-7-phosphate kinase